MMSAKVISFFDVVSVGKKKAQLKALLNDPKYTKGRSINTLVSKMGVEKKALTDMLNSLGAKCIKLNITSKKTGVKKEVEGWTLNKVTPKR